MTAFIKAHRGDIILLSCLILLSLLLFLLFSLFRSPGKTVEISLDGKVIGSYPVDEDITVQAGKGNIVAISGGFVYMESADCKNQICVRHSPISKSGESIICLPNRVTVRITGDDGDAPDGISR